MTPKSFHTKMVGYLTDYEEHLLKVKPNGTALSHCSIVSEFLSFLFNYNLVGIEQITVSMCCSKFYAHYKRGKKEVMGKEEMKEVLRGYFVFVDGKYGVRSEVVMRGLEK